MPRKTGLFWLAALAAGWAADLLFWGKTPGISFVIWIALILVLGITLGWQEGVKPARRNLIPILAVLGMALVTFIRREPFTAIIGLLLSFLALFVLAFSYREGHWVWYRVRDHLFAGLRLIGSMFVGALSLRRKPLENGKDQAVKKPSRHIWSILLGLLLALPIVGVLASLLSSADPIFGERLADFLEIFNIEKLPEYIFRLCYILILAYFIAGSLVHAFYNKYEEKPDLSQDYFKPFLGWIEALVILIAVDLLFAAFVIIQFQYFFGGGVNITAEGFTYAEYARRGFFELVGVAVLSLLLYLGLGAITRREEKVHRQLFTGLAILLFALVLVMLVSSWMRLSMYEAAYGFSRLRTYTHVFIPWLAALLVATATLEIIRKQHRFALVLLTVIFGFGISLAILNVDTFIVDQNVRRAQRGEQFDATYLLSLSQDAVPAMFDAYHQADLSSKDHNALGGMLACMEKDYLPAEKTPWQSFHLSTDRAERLFEQNGSELDAYPMKNDDWGWEVQIDGEFVPCYPLYMD